MALCAAVVLIGLGLILSKIGKMARKIVVSAMSAVVILIGLSLILSNLVSTTNFNIGLALILLGLSNILLSKD